MRRFPTLGFTLIFAALSTSWPAAQQPPAPRPFPRPPQQQAPAAAQPAAPAIPQSPGGQQPYVEFTDEKTGEVIGRQPLDLQNAPRVDPKAQQQQPQQPAPAKK